MKTSLSDQIKNKREAFDHAVPPFGHFERFEQKLDNQEKRRTLQSRRWITATSIAAMLAVILIFQFTHSIRTQPIGPESVTEVAGYYNLQLNEEIDKIKADLSRVDFPNRQEIIEDLNAILKDNGESDFPKIQMPEEEKITLIVWRYNAKMQTLQHIQDIVENIQNKNNKL